MRELKNIIERVMIMQDVKSVIAPEDFPAEIKNVAPQAFEMDIGENFSFDPSHSINYKHLTETLANKVKDRILRKALELHKGNKTAAARQLGISRYTLIRELKKIGNHRESFDTDL